MTELALFRSAILGKVLGAVFTLLFGAPESLATLRWIPLMKKQMQPMHSQIPWVIFPIGSL
jgi:hypothetical protein